MDYVILGKTMLKVNKNGFGALPVQRVAMKDAVYLIDKAYEGGINYFDTARIYSDSEEKLGKALCDKRDKIVISSKTMAQDAEHFNKDLETSLKLLKTDYIDIFQFHNPAFCPKPDEENGLYDAMFKAKKDGKIRFIGITNHRLSVANEAIESGLYDTLQFPFSYLSTEKEISTAEKCKEKNMGFIAMKGLSGGLINDSAAAYAFMLQYDFAEPIWGMQKLSELEEFLSYQTNPPAFDERVREKIERDKKELAGDFCRGCGYCMPCPEEIEINTCARMSLMLRRAPQQGWLSEANQKKMKLIENCKNCGKCKSKCPYGLDTPALLKKNYEDYKTFL